MTASFSAGVKAEICRSFPQKHCCIQAECFGILLFCNSFGADGIRIITESREFAYMLPKLFKRGFDVDFDSFPTVRQFAIQFRRSPASYIMKQITVYNNLFTVSDKMTM